MTQPLSPAAQAVKDAVLALYASEKLHKFGWKLDAPTVVAALRALADQVLPASSPLDRGTWSPFAAQIRAEILTIADELEGGQ